MATIACSQCGYGNSPADIACARCGASLAAQRHGTEQPKIRSQPPEARPGSRLPNQLDWRFFLVLLIAGIGAAACHVGGLAQAALFLLGAFAGTGILFLDRLTALKQERQIARLWTSLAAETGLSYGEGDVSWLGRNHPCLHGEYRGHSVSMTAIFKDGGEYPDRRYVEVVVDANAVPGVSLSIHQKGILEGRSRALSGREGFDRAMVAKGAPLEAAERAARLIATTEPRWLEWVAQNHLSVNLQDSKLVCVEEPPLDTSVQMDLLNRLCDLANLAEEFDAGDARSA